MIQVLSDWNFWSRDLDIGFRRSQYLDLMRRFEETGQVVVVTGLRRAGKSTLIKQYIKSLIDAGADRKNFLYVNLEEARFAGELSLKFLQKAYESYLEIIRPSGKPRIFLDEVQHVEGLEKFVRGLHERNEAIVFVSGSSSKLLGKEFGTVLTGRHLDVVVFPFSFRELLEVNKINSGDKLEILSKKMLVKQLLRDYLAFGGLPLVVISKEKEILEKYFDDIILHDIAERHGIQKIDKLRVLAKYYLTNVGSPSSFRKISSFIGVSLDSVERFTEFFKEAYLITSINFFSFSLKEQEVNPKKIYSLDLGLRNVISFRFLDDLGKLYENLVFIELFKSGNEIYYFKKKGECDFIVKKSSKIIDAIQVCFTLTKENKGREVNGLLEALNELNLPQGLVITDDFEAKEVHGSKTILFTPLWKWILDTNTHVT